MMVIAAFAIAAMHVGTADHPMTMTMTTSISVTHASMSEAPHAGMPATMSAAERMAAAPVATSAGRLPAVHGQQRSNDMSMAMMCQLLVLVTAVGFLVRHLVIQRNGRTADVAPSTQALEHPHRGLRPARPPGLSMLCVANC